MHYAIVETRYKGPTDYHGSRYVVRIVAGPHTGTRRILPFDHAAYDAPLAAAEELLAALGVHTSAHLATALLGSGHRIHVFSL